MMRRAWRTLWRQRTAVGVVDFALISGPLFMLVFGTVEFGRLLWAREALQMTATEGARCIGVLASSCSSNGAYSATNAQSYIEGVASSWGITLTTANMTLTANATSGACSGMMTNVAEVTLNYTFQTAVPGLLTFMSGGNALTGHACFSKQS